MSFVKPFLILLFPAMLYAEPFFRGVSWGMDPDQVEVTELSEAQFTVDEKSKLDHLNYEVQVFEEEHLLQYTFSKKKLNKITLVWLASERQFRRRERPLQLANQVFDQWKEKLEAQFGMGLSRGSESYKHIEWKTSSEVVTLSSFNIGRLPLLKLRMENLARPLENQKQEENNRSD
jgi:hypothetical protein